MAEQRRLVGFWAVEGMFVEPLTIDAAGWIAAALTACCFACTRMLRLRALALMANLAFIAYGSLAELPPVLVLHLILAPLNAWHLFGQWRAAQRGAPAVHRGSASRPLPPSFIGPLDTQPLARRRPLREQRPVHAARVGIRQRAFRGTQRSPLR